MKDLDYGYIEELMRNGKKLLAIKYVREVTGCGLKDAKDFIESNFSSYSSSQSSTKSGGCYIATCVYGSYDCPEVWTLRRFRDNTLRSTWYGRTFIKIYYAVSPTVVRLFGKTKWFRRLWKAKLDKLTAKLNSQGVENTPYND
jgi:hypothetical protein